MNRAAPVSRALAQVVLSAPSHPQALREAAAFAARELSCSSVELLLEAGSRTLCEQVGSAQRDYSSSVRYGAVALTLAHNAQPGVECDTLADLLGLAFHARIANESATMDALTGVGNRGALESKLRAGLSGSLAMIDIDYFKAYNDTNGHIAGDAVLRRVAHAASASLQRPGDFFARYGGEEFVAVLEDAALQDAVAAAERIREAVRALGIPHAGGKAGRISVSIGVANAQRGEDAAAVLARADEELYRAKSSGRDRVCAPGYTGARSGAAAFLKPYVSLLGRENELQRIMNTIDHAPVVTITGASGTGKTRLAFNAACLLANRYAGVVFIDAWSALDAEDLARRLQAFVPAGPSGLAVLDGCEHLTQSVGEVIAQLRARNVRVLAASRVPLGVRDEGVVRLSALDAHDAGTLFRQSAQWAGALAEPANAVIDNLQRRLGGNPESIVAAAVKLGAASPAELLEEIAERGSIGAERSSMQSIVSDAFASLNGNAQVLATLSVFADAFTAADAAALLNEPAMDEPAATRALELLHAMGLIARENAAWTVLDVLREAAGEEEGTRAWRKRAERRHIEWCLERFAKADRENGRVENQGFIDCITPITREIDAALQRALTDRDLTALGMELCWNAARFWFVKSRLAESVRWCQAFLDTNRGGDLWRLRMLASLTRIAYIQGRIGDMELYALAALPLTGAEPGRRAAILNFLGIAAIRRGEADNAMEFFRESRDCSIENGNRRGEAIAVASMGSVSMDLNLDFEAASARFEPAVRIFRELDDQLNALMIESNLVETSACSGDLKRAMRIAQRILPETRALNNKATLLFVLSTYATALERIPDEPALRAAVAEASSLLQNIEPSQYHTLFDLAGRLYQVRGEAEAATMLFVASEWSQIRDGQQVLPIERFHHERAYAVLGVDAQAQGAAMIRVRGMTDDELLHLVTQAVLGAVPPAAGVPE